MKKTISLALFVAVLGLSCALVLGSSGEGAFVPDPLSAAQDSSPLRPVAQDSLAKAAFG